ncbi:MAG: beta-ketoacyl synthase N-terminal-like domain-containing protein, partial [Planctomycetota bacterium]|nr:beta-ketoacyl synthase N-terminal-like domain-containing protein [Planctomycetota bacterium]
MKHNNDVVVTGLGMVSPIGIGLEAFTESLLSKKSGIKTVEMFAGTDWPFRIGGVVEDY